MQFVLTEEAFCRIPLPGEPPRARGSARGASDHPPIAPRFSLTLSDVRLLAPGNHILSSLVYPLVSVCAALGTRLEKDEGEVHVLRLHVFESIFILSACFPGSLAWNSRSEIMVFQEFDAIVSFSFCFLCYKRGSRSHCNSRFFVFDVSLPFLPQVAKLLCLKVCVFCAFF